MPRLKDGYPTRISFATFPNIELYEKSVTPAGFDMGGPIDTATMYNEIYRTKFPKFLVTTTPMNFEAAWDPVNYVDLLDVLGFLDLIAVTFRNGGIATGWGWLDKWVPSGNKEGEMPLSACTIEWSNETDLGVEAGFAYTPPA